MAINPGHDGAIAVVGDGKLLYSLESEKDSFPAIRGDADVRLRRRRAHRRRCPDVVALGGWRKREPA